MGEKVKRPLHEGIGEKPATHKPSLRDDMLRAHAGEKPKTPKPAGQPTVTKPAHDEKA